MNTAAALIGGTVLAAMSVIVALLLIAIATDFHDGGLDATDDIDPQP